VGSAFAIALFAALALAGWLRMRNALARLEQKIRRLRELHGRELRYRPLEPGEDALRATLDGLDDHTAQLRAAGLEILGELVEEHESRVATRWFVDAARTTFGWIGMARTRGMAIPIALFASHAEDLAVYTRRVPKIPSVVMPPFIRRQDLPGATPIADALARHRSFAGDGPWVRIDSLDDVIREMPRIRRLVIAWREAQPPVELLDADLRAILGKHYERLGAQLARRLAPELPRARAL